MENAVSSTSLKKKANVDETAMYVHTKPTWDFIF